ncbi:trypsin alpha-3-like [Scaptodrosophila lebanonensis]|uniref:trypsin n=1 Tax=Drosophila lebanonensis TaxID=7225 RepID=A0A6J2UD95_DROLE|nr:trypsin alpha-3-like [Scaptodrosophila lebanonensis]
MVLKYLIFICLLICCSSEFSPELARIVEGEVLGIEKVPWQVSLLYQGTHHCGGVIYDNEIILTAAHCVVGYSTSKLTVRAGSTISICGGQLVSVAKILVHEDYSHSRRTNDIAVILLKDRLSFNNAVHAIKLARSSPAHGVIAFVSGWGALDECREQRSDHLRGTQLKIVGREQCASESYGYGEMAAIDTICTYAPGKSPNGGDSGGPLVYKNELVGLVSWGIGCGREEYPGIFADVAYHREWILNAIQRVRNLKINQI